MVDQENHQAERQEFRLTHSNYLKWLVRFIIYIPLGLLVIIALALGTELGTKSVISIADSLFDEISITHKSGSLNNKIALSKASIHLSGVNVDLKNLLIEWQPLCLLKQQICAKTINASDVLVTIQTTALNNTASAPTNHKLIATTAPVTDDSNNAQQSLVLPFSISLSSAQLNNVHVTIDDMTFSAAQLQTQAKWIPSGLFVTRLLSQSLNVMIPVEQSGGSTQANELKLPSAQQDDIVLPLFRMPFNIEVNHASLLDSHVSIGKINEHIKNIEIEGTFVQHHLSLTQLKVETLLASADLTGDLDFIQNYPTNIDVNLKIHSEDSLQKYAHSNFSLHSLASHDLFQSFAEQNIQLSAAQSVADLSFKLWLKGENTLLLNGRVAPLKKLMPFEIALTDGQYMGSIDGHELQFANLTLDVKGDLQTQDASLSSSLVIDGHKLERVVTHITNKQKTSELEIKKLELSSANSTIKALGRITYQDSIAWQTNFNSLKVNLDEVFAVVNQFSPGTITKTQAEYTGEIVGNINSAGFWQPNSIKPKASDTQDTKSNSNDTDNSEHAVKWKVQVNNANLSGHIKDLPFAMQGSAQINSNLAMSSQGLMTSALGSTLNISGNANNEWQLTSTLLVPDVSYWHPDAKGAIKAQLSVNGEKSNPLFTLNALANDITFQDIHVENSQLKAYYLPKNANQFGGSFKTTAIHYQELTLDSMTLASKGNNFKQKLGIHTYGDVRIDSAIYNNSEETALWQTEIRDFSVASHLGKWILDKPTRLTWQTEEKQGTVSPFCLNHPQNQLCINKPVLFGTKGDVDLGIKGNVGKLLAPLLPTNIAWDGEAVVALTSNWSEQQKPQAHIDINFKPGQFDILQDKQHTLNMDYQTLDASLSLNNQQLHTKLNFESQHIATIDSELTIQVNPGRDLKGYVNVNSINLESFSAFLPTAETLAGSLSSKLILQGSLSEPHINGTIALVDGKLASRANPTLLDQIQLTALLDGSDATLNGHWAMGKGSSQMEGILNWQDGGLNGKLSVVGDNLELIQPPMAILTISPDLKIEFNQNHIDVKGKLIVPSGSIILEQLPEGAVDVSQDVVYENSAAEEQQNPVTLSTQLHIAVEDKVNVSGLGLQGQLKGTLELEQQANRPPLLFGDIKVINASYKFMGQTLSINTGELQFVGPAAFPNLNIEAFREIKAEDMVAGVRITGTPNKPIVTLFSTPHKEQAEILSYIIKGQGFNDQDTDSNSLMMGAAIGLGSHLGGNALNNIGDTTANLAEKLGFNNVQFDTNDEGRVAISGYIGENLMVKYGVGVFNPGYEMTVRYFLLSQLYLETISGTLGQSLDIYYNFDL